MPASTNLVKRNLSLCISDKFAIVFDFHTTLEAHHVPVAALYPARPTPG